MRAGSSSRSRCRRVGARLRASVESAEPTDDGALYAEKTLGGWAVLQGERPAARRSNVDLETLFNAVTAKEGRVRACSSRPRAAKGDQE